MFCGVEQGLFPIVARPALQSLVEPGVRAALEAEGKGGDGEDAQALLRRKTEDLVSSWNGTVIACFLLGAATGGMVFGWLGDRIGRVRAMVLAILTFSLFTGAKYFAAAPPQIAVLRFVASLGMGGQWTLGVALVVECWPERLRPLMAGVIGASANVGFLLIALLGVWMPPTRESWRWMLAVGATPALLAAYVALCVPESQRWRASVSHGVAKPLHEVFGRGLRKRTLLAIAFASIALIGTWGAVSGWLTVWVDQLTGGKMPAAKSAVQVAVSIGAILGCLFAPVLGGQVGRRPAYFILCLLSLGVCAFLFRVLRTYDVVFLVTSGLAGLVTAAFYGWAPLYLPELFPTRVRATGQGLSFNFGRILAAAGALQMGQLVAFFGGNYARAGATITLIYALGLVLIWFAPETKGKPLPG
ncbi:MAG: MFS transporter [Planctomycetes bacterium]|nr:MFS transporter [Planctomycetota bacterium]